MKTTASPNWNFYGGQSLIEITQTNGGVVSKRTESWTGLLDKISDIVDLSPEARDRIDQVRKEAADAQQIIDQMRASRRTIAQERLNAASKRVEELKKLIPFLMLMGNRAALREVLKELKYLAKEVGGAVAEARSTAAVSEVNVGLNSNVAATELHEIAADIAQDGLPGSASQNTDPEAAKAAQADPELTQALDTPEELQNAFNAVIDSAAHEDAQKTADAEKSDQTWLADIEHQARGTLDEIRKLINLLRMMFGNSNDKKEREALKDADDALAAALKYVGPAPSETGSEAIADSSSSSDLNTDAA